MLDLPAFIVTLNRTHLHFFPHICNSVTCIPLSIGQTLTTEWLFGRAACQLVPFFMQVTKTSGVLTLCCMAGERFLAIVYPLKVGSLQVGG